MADELKVGDPVTLVFRAHTTLCSEVDRITGQAAYTVNTHLPRELEGVTWIRGHYIPTAPEVQAALSAAFLSGYHDYGAQGPQGVQGAVGPQSGRGVQGASGPQVIIGPQGPWSAQGRFKP